MHLKSMLQIMVLLVIALSIAITLSISNMVLQLISLKHGLNTLNNEISQIKTNNTMGTLKEDIIRLNMQKCEFEAFQGTVWGTVSDQNSKLRQKRNSIGVKSGSL